MKKIIIILTILLTLCSISIVKPPTEVKAAPGAQCCSGEFAVDIDGFSAGNQPQKPFLGKCIFEDCYNCLAYNSCDPGWLGNVTGMNTPAKFRAYCDSNRALRFKKYECAARDPNDTLNFPGEACDEAINQCVALPVVSQTVPCNGGTCVDTSFGGLQFEYGPFLNQVILIGVSIGSGIAFLMLIYGSFKTMTSKGNPDGITEGKEIITSAVAGLVFIIFSVTIMQVIGVDILGLDRFGF